MREWHLHHNGKKEAVKRRTQVVVSNRSSSADIFTALFRAFAPSTVQPRERESPGPPAAPRPGPGLASRPLRGCAPALICAPARARLPRTYNFTRGSYFSYDITHARLACLGVGGCLPSGWPPPSCVCGMCCCEAPLARSCRCPPPRSIGDGGPLTPPAILGVPAALFSV